MTTASEHTRPVPTSVHEDAIDSPPGLVHSAWLRDMPWLVQGCTTRGSEVPSFDLGLFNSASSKEHVAACWDELRTATGLDRAMHARQVHGADVRYQVAGPTGLHLSDDCDGHVTGAVGVLLAVATADCVPVFVVDPGRRSVAALHSGWRGAAAGVLERGITVMVENVGSRREELLVHLGPSICGACYEVGPEVFEALDQPVPPGPKPIDLRAVLSERAARVEVPMGHITVSAHCTRCTGSGLYSHRNGDRQRQVGYIGVRP